MSFDHALAVVTASIALASFIFFLVQIWIQVRDANRQRRRDSRQKVVDANQELLSLGFPYPQLFNILIDGKCDNPQWERRYLQMWLNQLSQIHSSLIHGDYDADFQYDLERNIVDFMTLQNMQRHWKQHGEFYSPSFQRLVNEILKRIAAPPTVPPHS